MPHGVQVALFEPDIPPNVGAVARTCVATGTPLHLIGRLGFQIDDNRIRRAGLDYWQHVDLRLHADLPSAVEAVPNATWYHFSTHARRNVWDVQFAEQAVFLFGNEARGLPESVRDDSERGVRLPILDGRVRSLNLSNSVAVAVYEALRQRRDRVTHD